MVAMDEIYGSRARIGYTSPPLLTEVFAYDFYRLAPAGVTLVLTSLAILDRNKDEVDRSYEISMQAARHGVVRCRSGGAGRRADQPVARLRQCRPHAR